jgi:hypothetical protein
VTPTATVSAITAAVISLALIASVAVLTWHGDITGEAAVAFFAAIAGGAGAAGVGHVATKTGAEAARTAGYGVREPMNYTAAPPPK